MNQLDVINIQRKAIQTVQIIDIQGQPKRSKCNDREETMSAIMTVVAIPYVESENSAGGTTVTIG